MNVSKSAACVLALCALLLVVVSCSDDDPLSPNNTIQGSGILITDTLTVPAFHSFNLAAVGDVIVSQGASQRFVITVDDNILPHLTTSVNGGVLEIGVQPGVQLSDYDLEVQVRMVDIQRLSLSGVGTISSQDTLLIDSLAVMLSGTGNAVLDLEVGYFKSSVTGVGNVTAAGSVSSQIFSLSGQGALHAFDLASDTTVVNIDGVGSADVTVSELLDITIGGTGTVHYKGRPAINVSISGSGDVVDAN